MGSKDRLASAAVPVRSHSDCLRRHPLASTSKHLLHRSRASLDGGGRPMPVRRRGDAGARVAEHVSHYLQGNAGRREQARSGCRSSCMPAPEAGLLRDSPQRPPQVGWVEQRSAAGRENKVEVGPVLPHRVLLRLLARAVLLEGVLGVHG